MQYAVPVIVIWVIIFFAFEYPIFGIVLLVSILAFSIWMWIQEKVIWPKEREKEEAQNEIRFKQRQKEEKQKEKRKKDLNNKLSEDIQSIIENNIKILRRITINC